jgi:hypothetical protein
MNGAPGFCGVYVGGRGWATRVVVPSRTAGTLFPTRPQKRVRMGHPAEQVMEGWRWAGAVGLCPIPTHAQRARMNGAPGFCGGPWRWGGVHWQGFGLVSGRFFER